MHRPATSCLTAAALAALLGGGCAHHKANQYAYAPPLAPPVYPQPQSVAQPVAGPLPGPVVAAPALPTVPAAPGVSVTMGERAVPANADGSCPPCASGAVPVAYEEAVQTQPCPQ